MADLAVWFYREDLGDAEQWVWFQAHSAPAVGDLMVTPRGSRWEIVARTWVEQNRCNVTVRSLDGEQTTNPEEEQHG